MPRSAALLLLLALPACAAAEPRTGQDGRLLAAHNAVRAEAGVPPLRWDPALAASARTWALSLAARGTLAHDPARAGQAGNAQGGNAQGENLWMGTAGAFTPEAMVGTWASERAAYRRDRRWEDSFPAAGHYTQLIWRGTTALGCGLATAGRTDVLVCRYAPPGNVAGGRP